MCVIVDVNVARSVFLDVSHADFGIVRKCIVNASPYDLVLVYGGRLLREYLVVAEVRRFVAVLDRAGRTRRIADECVDEEEVSLIKGKVCRSDDEHIVALARISGARLLCSKDQDLQSDFTDRKLISGPRGKVYQRQAHKALLRPASQHRC